MRCARFLLAAWLPLAAVAAPPDTIYFGGPILTMHDALPVAGALAVTGKTITAVGSKADLLSEKGPATQLVDLAGKPLLPGFIDGHSHFFQSALMPLEANCSSPPAGPCRSIPDIVEQLQAKQRELKTPQGRFIFGYGYDPDLLAEKRHPTKADLDGAFPDNPVLLLHVSSHGAVLNSQALKKFGITAATKTPPGGVIARLPGSQEPSGLLMETAFIPIFTKLPIPPLDRLLELLNQGQSVYPAAGITTAQEGATSAGAYKLLRAAADRGLLDIDVISYPLFQEFEAATGRKTPFTERDYTGRLRIGGVKLLTDGSPQGRTAYFSTPYRNGGPAGQKNWRGEPTQPQAELNAMVKLAYDNEAQVLVHCNGDAAIDTLLEAHRYAAADDLAKDRRTIGIHSQFIRPDQLQRYADWKITPSFFTVHTFYFGQTHIANRGLDQAQNLSPFRSALDFGLQPTNHTDYSVVPLDQLFTVHTAVNRTMRDGTVLGPDERIKTLEALKALTINAARQYREEAQKGTLEPGKLADLVILSENPLTAPPATLKTIRVVETIKEGKSVYPTNDHHSRGMTK